MTEVSENNEGPQRCLVYCRLRPARGPEVKEEPLLTLKGPAVSTRDDKVYNFDNSFGADSTQEQIFDAIAKPCLDHALNGFRSALLAYGQTGTGKSHTMCCSKPGQEGIIPRAANYLFDTINEAAASGKQYSVRVQFLQIYRDNLGDLMSETGKERVDIVFDKDKGVTLPGCSIHTVTNAEEFMNIYREGDKRRVTAATAMNPESSRGHTALVTWVACTHDNAEMHGKITFIDLAGYERFSKTGISSDGVMKEEAKTINASLLALGHVVTALSNGDKHIPWRDAKLTRLLQDSIGGRSRTTIVLTVGPSPSHLFETTNTLQFGVRAMAVKVQAKVSVTVDYERLAAKLQSILSEREERINALELQNAAFNMQEAELLSRHDRDLEQLRKSQEEEIAALHNMTQEQIIEYKRQQEVELQNLVEQQKEEVKYAHEQNQQHTKEIVDRITAQHERTVASMELRIQELEDEINELKSQQQQQQQQQSSQEADAAAPAAEVRKPTRKCTLSDMPDIESLAVGGRIDVNVYYDVVDAYEEALEMNQEKTVSMQTRLDHALKLANERAEDLAAVEEYIKKSKSAAAEDEDSIATTVSNILEGKKSARGTVPKLSHVEMIDSKVHEQMIEKYTQELKDKDNVIEGLRKLIYSGNPKATADRLGVDLNSSSLSALKDGLPYITPRFTSGGVVLTARLPVGVTPRVPSMMSSPRTSRGGPQCYGSSSTQTMLSEQLKLQLQMLQDKLEEVESANVRLSDELALRKLKDIEKEESEEDEPDSPEKPSTTPVPKLALGTKVKKTKKDKLAENPLIKELNELRELLEKEKKEKHQLETEFGSLLTQVDQTEFRRVRDPRTQIDQEPKGKGPENEIRVAAHRGTRNYYNYAMDLFYGAFGRRKHDTIIILGMGAAVTVAVNVAEALKSSVKGLHQVTEIDGTLVHDYYEGQETGKVFEFHRHVPTIKITLSLKTLDRKAPGYQAPIPESKVKPNRKYEGNQPQQATAGGVAKNYSPSNKDGRDRRESRVDPNAPPPSSYAAAARGNN